MHAFWRNITVGADGKVQDPVNDKIQQKLTAKMTQDPAKLVSSFTRTEQGHLYVKQMVKETVEKVMTVQRNLEQDMEDEPTWQECALETCIRFLGGQYKLKMKNKKHAVLRDYMMNVSLENAVNFNLGERNLDMNEYKWCLVVYFCRPNFKVNESGGYYLNQRQVFQLKQTFDGPGARHGRDADSATRQDFEEWEREMLQTGSPLYRAYVELMQQYGKLGRCKYCRSGVTYDSYVCEECACEWNWKGCACCGEYLGKLTDAGVHEMCLEE